MVTKGLAGVRDSHDDVHVLEKWKPEPVKCVRGKLLQRDIALHDYGCVRIMPYSSQLQGAERVDNNLQGL
jgi:hypothetical protein